MAKVKLFCSRNLVDIRYQVESFLNETNGIQILDITWTHANSHWHCIITYFEVE